MSILEYVIRQQDVRWEVWLGDRLVSRHPTRTEAVSVAEVLAQGAVARGERAKILAGTMDGVAVEIPLREPKRQRA